MEFIPRIGITTGDINGIGPEVLLKALNTHRVNKICIPVLYGSGKHLSKYKNLVGMQNWQYTHIQDASQAQQKNFNLVNCLKGEYFDLTPGSLDPKAGQLAYDSLERATQDLKSGKIDALVTAPISKENIQSDTFKFPGHTEYLAQAFEKKDVLMFMISDGLRIGVVTGHIPLDKVKKVLSREAIASKLNLMLQSLKTDFGIAKPRIAVLGLNPHAGENGLLGDEEKQVITPVIEQYKNKGHLVFGPFPTDGFFASDNFRKFDAILAMYHDQGLTPFKMLAFDTGVNFTAGIPGVRTSPDHGTGFDIAGKNVADPGSMLHAIYAAADISRQRHEYNDLEAHALKHQKIDIENLKKEKN
ncbi:4-hydroxythreonine-4-phosphate dehydrogenase PdxA [Leadbetterella sp. DM7]|uniref:4-hydroxythreonine-4-phosphate dehydrogenase PdxA n=1 Tax=Leadbetterella sp. DM7 TaxID=3235085 RepID=UPI00349ED0C2